MSSTRKPTGHPGRAYNLSATAATAAMVVTMAAVVTAVEVATTAAAATVATAAEVATTGAEAVLGFSGAAAAAVEAVEAVEAAAIGAGSPAVWSGAINIARSPRLTPLCLVCSAAHVRPGVAYA
jgi:hypothetical protein